MAKNLNALVLVLLTVATFLHGSLAQTKHVVGDSTGWTIASGGAQFYSNWASKQTFTVGDTLVFNFANGAHDVSKVTKTAYDGCNGATTISKITTSPASVTLNETGQQYFLCSFPGHCSAGQKLSINVVKASASPVPAPKPSATPPKASAPVAAPTPATTASPAPAPTPAINAPPAPAPTTADSPAPAATGTSPSSDSPSGSAGSVPSSQSPGGSASAPPPENSGAGSLGVAGLFVTLLSVAAAFFC